MKVFEALGVDNEASNADPLNSIGSDGTRITKT